MTDYAQTTYNTATDAFAQRAAALRAANFANMQNQQQYQTQQQATPGVLAALSSMNNQGPQPPMPGQPSLPSQPPMGGPNVSQMPPMNAPQAAQNGIPNSPMAAPAKAPLPPPDPNMGGLANQPGASGPLPGGGPSISPMPAQPQQTQQQQAFGQQGASIQQMLQAISQAMPNASPQVKLAALTQAQGYLNNDAKQQLAMLKAQFMPQTMHDRDLNAESGAWRAAASANNSNANTATRFDPNNPSPPVGYIIPGDQGGQPTISPTSSSRLSAAAAQSQIAEDKADARQLGTLKAATDQYSGILPLAQKASKDFPRGQLKAFVFANNQLADQSNNPKYADFITYTNGLIREYARGMGGTVSAQSKISDLLNARDDASYQKIAKDMQTELQAAERSGNKGLGIPDNTPQGEDDGWGKDVTVH